jgi:protease-4
MRRLVRIVVGTFALIGLLVVAGTAGGIWAFLSIHDRVEPQLPKRMILSLNLEAPFREAEDPDPFSRFSGEPGYVLRDVVAALDAAAKDEHVAGLFATIGQTKLSMAAAQDVRDAVTRFRASGKPAFVFGETLGEFGNGTVAAYVSSAFGQVWLQPSGDYGLSGLSVEAPFLKGALDMLGIRPQFGARKEYKTALETFTETGFTAAHAETLNGLLDSWSSQVIAGIAEGRLLPAEKVRALFGSGPFLANEALSAGLVDKLGYYQDAWEAVAGDTKPKKVDVATYAQSVRSDKGAKVAVITGIGAIQRGDEESGFGSQDRFLGGAVAKAIRDAAQDSSVKAIVLRIDSPGGSYVASDTIWNEVRKARAAGKPVVASMAGVAASGGYFVAMAADRIVAQPGTITGSIGVFSGKMVLSDFWQKLGISWDELHRGDNATMWSFNQPFPPQAWDRMNIMLDRIYDDFTAKAAEGRKLSRDKLEAVAKGRVWSGQAAKTVGLVDTLGGWPETLSQVRQVAGLAADAPLTLVDFPARKEPWEKVVRMLAGRQADAQALDGLARAAAVLAPVARQFEVLDPRAGALRAPVRP